MKQLFFCFFSDDANRAERVAFSSRDVPFVVFASRGLPKFQAIYGNDKFLSRER